MKALFYSKNLLGDSLQTTVALRAFYNQNVNDPLKQPFSMTIATLDDYIALVYERMEIPVEVYRGDPALPNERDYDFVFNFDISKAFSLGVASNIPACLVFCTMLGVTPERAYPFFKYKLPMVIHEKMHLEHAMQQGAFILFQPYSISCSSHTGEQANKRWPDECWQYVYECLQRDYPELQIRVLGGERDEPIPGIPEELHLFNLPLDEVAYRQQQARLILSIDNGAAHLAASQEARMIELYPGQCLPTNWMSNSESPNVRIISARPWDVSEDWIYGQVVRYLKEIASCPDTHLTASLK